MSSIREIGRFFAKTDSGKEYEVIQYQRYEDVTTMDSPEEEIPTTKFMKTTNDLDVHYIDSETFEIVQTNEIIRKV